MQIVTRSLSHTLDVVSILEAGVAMIEEGRYYYTLTTDPGSTNGTYNGTELEMTTSRIFDTYEEAVLALNIRISQTVVEGGLLPA
jgi:hypothetical protein